MRNRDKIFIDNLIFYEQTLLEIGEKLMLSDDDLNYADPYLKYRFWGFLSNYVELILKNENVAPYIFKLKDFEQFRYHSPQIRDKVKKLFEYLNEDFKKIKNYLSKDQLQDFKNNLNYTDHYLTTDDPGKSKEYSYENFFQIITSNPFPEKFKVYGQPINEYYKGILEVYLKLRQEIIQKYTLESFAINQECFLIIKSLEDDLSFELDFNGTLAVIKLIQVYNQLHPAKRIPLEVYFYNGLEPIFGINEIQKKDIEEILHHIKHLNFLIKQFLSEGYSKEHLVLKFRTYCELYQKDLFVEEAENERYSSAERFFQSKFNEFIFQNGYYPITEAQLALGRLDTLAISEKQILLYEMKQIGFKKSEVSERNILEAIQSAMTQVRNYHNRLYSLPYLDKNLFIIICSKVPISLSEPIKHEGGLIVHIIVIDFSPYRDSEKSKHTIHINEI